METEREDCASPGEICTEAVVAVCSTSLSLEESGLGDEISASQSASIDISISDDCKKDLGSVSSNPVTVEETSEISVQKAASKESKQKVNVIQLFRFSNGLERIMILVGLVFAMCHGLALQIPYLFMSDIITEFSIIIQYNCSEENLTSVECEGVMTLSEASEWIMIRLSICMIFICGSVFLQFLLFTVAADRITRRVRFQAFSNILRQHTGYFDIHSGGELNTRLTQDIIKFEVGIGGKFSLTISYLTCFFSGLIICLVEGWMLTLFMCVLLPVAGIVSGITTRLIKLYTEKEMAAHASAGSVAEEAFTNIRVVTAFSGQSKEVERYEKVLKNAQKITMRSALASAVGQGVPWLLTFTITALTAFFSSRMIRDGKIETGFVMLLLGCMMQGLRGLGYAAVLLENISDSQGAAFGIYQIIDAKTEIDSFNPDGKKPEKLLGHVRFEQIHFEYPARSDVPVLRGLTLEIRPGQSAALVGPSGCGKSTTIQLIQRCYEPRQGKVYLDDHDIRDLNIGWLRQQIGVVSQDPVLFATSIEENIRFGRPDATLDEIIDAAREADAHSFIDKLSNKYETVLNEQGTQLSRGEKQRISLARALIRNPRILLLDECTSALDNESEAAVQAALDKASRGRTTIVIAHRLSTVRDCDVLFVVNNGVVEESGSHSDLLARGGLYSKLVSSQIHVVKEEKSSLDSLSSDEEVENDDESTIAFPEKIFERATKTTGSSLRGSAISTTSHCSTMSTISEVETTPIERYALLKVFALNRREFPLLILGVLGGLLLGCTYPVFAILFSNVIEAILNEEIDMDIVSDMSAGMLGLGIVCCFVAFMSILLLRIFGETLTLKLRKLAFSAMLHQEIGWFDAAENQAGSLTSKLADESSRIKLATGSTLLYFVSAFSNVGCSIAIAIIFSWQLGLALLPVMPVAIIAGIVQGYMNSTFERNSHACTASSGKIASEAIDKIRTLASLTKEKFYLDRYMANFDVIKKEAKKRGIIIGASWVFLYACGLAIEIITFGFGLRLVEEGKMEFKIIFRMLLVALIMCTEVGRANSNVPELTSSRAAAQSLLTLVNRSSKIDPRSDKGQKPEACVGDVSLTGVSFRYPARQQRASVLRRVTLSAARGQTVAIVGPSGGGKTTVIQLIQRFYDIFSGVVKIDGVDIRELNVEWLRSQIGVVFQDPILFAVSLADNIAYGDNSRYATREEIIEAAKEANIHTFISSLPQGYDTNVGNKGAQLSGGQKQRVSIARALLRNPKILLLDDATSALDSHSESIVEEALSRAREGRTCIAVAHRLSSVVKADVILYMYNGRVLERGGHSELMHLRGHYYSLFQANLGNKTS